MEASMNAELSIVVPLYNEEENIEELYARLTPVLVDLGKRYELIFVDDGSHDRTFKLLAQLQTKDDKVHVIRLRRNFGRTGALAAGFDFAEGAVIVSMDGDLQPSPEATPFLSPHFPQGSPTLSARRAK